MRDRWEGGAEPRTRRCIAQSGGLRAAMRDVHQWIRCMHFRRQRGRGKLASVLREGSAVEMRMNEQQDALAAWIGRSEPFMNHAQGICIIAFRQEGQGSGPQA